MQELPISFERGLYQAVIRFKQSHPGVLEDRTRERKEKEWKACRTVAKGGAENDHHRDS